MSESGERLVGLVDGGSRGAIDLVRNFISPAANFFASCRFATSPVTYSEIVKTFEFENNAALEIGFLATKLCLKNGGPEWNACFNIHLAKQTAWKPGDYWPEDEGSCDRDARYVKEVREFMIDDKDFAPQTETYWQYMIMDEDGEMETVTFHSFDDSVYEVEVAANGENISPEMPQELSELGNGLTESFYEEDVALIMESINRLGYVMPDGTC